MVLVNGKNLSKRDFYAHFGDPLAYAGIMPMILDSGKATGVKALRMFTGTGLDFTVLPSRAMDISLTTYNGKSISYLSKTGIVHPHYYDARGIEWLRGFFGGLLTTCGLTYMGAPNIDQGEELGLHGRITHAEAEDLQISQEWKGDDLICSVSGKVREARLFGENITMTRKITFKAGENKFIIENIFENLGFEPKPLQVLFHFNIGYPLLSSDTKIFTPAIEVIARDDEARRDEGLSHYMEFDEPTPNFAEQVYFHELKGDSEGETLVAVINEPLSLGLYEKWNLKEIGQFTQWKCTSQSEYVLGMEPGTATPMGRNLIRESGNMKMIQPGETLTATIEIGILTNTSEFEEIKKKIAEL